MENTTSGVQWKDCLLLFLAFMFYQAIFLYLGDEFFGNSATKSRVFSIMLSSLLTISTAYLISGRNFWGSDISSVGICAISLRNATISFAVGILIAFIVATATSYFPDDNVGDPHAEFLNRLLESGVAMLFLFGVTVIILGPIAEELIFRGFILSWIGQRLGWALGIVISSIFFLLIHLSQVSGYLVAILGITMLGVTCSLIRMLTKSLLGSIIAHASYNAVIFIVFLQK